MLRLAGGCASAAACAGRLMPLAASALSTAAPESDTGSCCAWCPDAAGPAPAPDPLLSTSSASAIPSAAATASTAVDAVAAAAAAEAAARPRAPAAAPAAAAASIPGSDAACLATRPLPQGSANAPAAAAAAMGAGNASRMSRARCCSTETWEISPVVGSRANPGGSLPASRVSCRGPSNGRRRLTRARRR